MKVRAMKKYIPYGIYCYGEIKSVDRKTGIIKTTGMCKNLIYIGKIDDIKTIPIKPGNIETKEVPCKSKVYRCRYTGVSTLDDFCLYDSCKICGEKEPKDKDIE